MAAPTIILSEETSNDPSQSLHIEERYESRLTRLFENFKKRFPDLFEKPHLQGGEGSGNFGHEGRPGEVGGSGPGGNVTVSHLTVRETEGYEPELSNGKTPNDAKNVFNSLPVAQSEFVKTLTNNDFEFLRGYVGGSNSYDINQYLKYGPGEYSQEQIAKFERTRDHLINLADKAPALPEGVELFTGVRGRQAEILDGIDVGSEIKSAGFQSASTSSQWASVFTEPIMGENYPNNYDDHRVMVRIVTSGTEHAIPGSAKEGEVIFKPGESWRVIGTDHIKGTYESVDVDFKVISVKHVKR